MIRASDWRPMPRNSLQGFISLRLEPSGLELRDCTFHRLGDREWIGLPGKQQIDRDGQPRKDPTTGKTLYQPVVEIPAEARIRLTCIGPMPNRWPVSRRLCGS